MKLLVGIIVFCFLAKSAYAIDMEEAKKIFMAAAETCKASTGVSDADIAKFKGHELVETQEGKCFATCVMKTMGLMTPDNKTNRDTVMMGISLMFADNPEKAKKAEEIVDECIGVTDADECEASYKIGQCWKAAKEAKGLTMDM